MGKHSFAHRQVSEDVYAGAVFLEVDLMRRKLLQYFSGAERLLWGLSVVFIVGSFCAFDRENYLTLADDVQDRKSTRLNSSHIL